MTNSNHSREPRAGFTLVEMLMVLILISLMGGMVVAAVQGVTKSAKEARTRSIIAAIDSVIQEQYESYKYRAISIDIPETFNPVNFSGNEVGFEVLAVEAARVRLMMIRDLQRMEMPDRLSDLVDATLSTTTNLVPSGIVPMRAAASPVLKNASEQILDTRADKTQRRMFQATWYQMGVSGDYPSRFAGYFNRLPIPNPPTKPFDVTDPTSAAYRNQGAECLYLIMATSFVAGTPSIEAIPESNIGDTDGDGLPEILDGWGNPLGFIRWPVGYFDPGQSVETTNPDDFDLFRSDLSYATDILAPDQTSWPLEVNSAVRSRPWSMRPLVFSAGPDGDFGIATNPWTTGGEQTAFSYQDSLWFWPTNSTYYGPSDDTEGELGGRDVGPGAVVFTSHPFPDPYLRRFIALNLSGGVFNGLLPGQILATSTALDELADNMTNYQLQSDQ